MFIFVFCLCRFLFLTLFLHHVNVSNDGPEEESLARVVGHTVGHEFGQLLAVRCGQLTLRCVKPLLLLREMTNKKMWHHLSAQKRSCLLIHVSNSVRVCCYLCELFVFEGYVSVVTDLPQSCPKAPLIRCYAQISRVQYTLGSNPRNPVHTLCRHTQSKLSCMNNMLQRIVLNQGT